VLFDHNSDHRQLRTTRNQWRIKVTKASFPEQKGLKTTQKHRKKRILSLWDVEAASSSLVTPMQIRFMPQESRRAEMLCGFFEYQGV